MQLPPDDMAPVEVRLGDLDIKTAAKGKARYWLSIEQRLIDEGWYAGERPTQIHSECALHPGRRNDDLANGKR